MQLLGTPLNCVQIGKAKIISREIIDIWNEPTSAIYGDDIENFVGRVHIYLSDHIITGESGGGKFSALLFSYLPIGMVKGVAAKVNDFFESWRFGQVTLDHGIIEKVHLHKNWLGLMKEKKLGIAIREGESYFYLKGELIQIEELDDSAYMKIGRQHLSLAKAAPFESVGKKVANQRRNTKGNEENIKKVAEEELKKEVVDYGSVDLPEERIRNFLGGKVEIYPPGRIESLYDDIIDQCVSSGAIYGKNSAGDARLLTAEEAEDFKATFTRSMKSTLENIESVKQARDMVLEAKDCLVTSGTFEAETADCKIKVVGSPEEAKEYQLKALRLARLAVANLNKIQEHNSDLQKDISKVRTAAELIIEAAQIEL